LAGGKPATAAEIVARCPRQCRPWPQPGRAGREPYAGGELRLRYRLLLPRGDEHAAQIAPRFRHYAREPL